MVSSPVPATINSKGVAATSSVKAGEVHDADDEVLMKCLGDTMLSATQTVLHIFDFGRQPVFLFYFYIGNVL